MRPTILLVPRAHDEPPGPWSSLADSGVAGVRRAMLPTTGTADLNRWAAGVATSIDACRAPPLVVAHGFGALATLRATFLFERRIAGAMLVSPADPDHHGALARLPAVALPYPTLVVASRDDPTLKLTKAGALATRWGARLVVLGAEQAADLARLLRGFARQLAAAPRETEPYLRPMAKCSSPAARTSAGS
jgi:predicted alpha/beta hydrolase family esterase